ncbi:MAG: citramalate synthase, partial [Cyanobacteria bacterium P01_G01_bin.49]
KPENIVFNANLQEFAQQVGYICNLETAGKIESEKAYHQVKELWEKLEISKQQLKIGKNMFGQDDGEEPPTSSG